MSERSSTVKAGGDGMEEEGGGGAGARRGPGDGIGGLWGSFVDFLWPVADFFFFWLGGFGLG